MRRTSPRSFFRFSRACCRRGAARARRRRPISASMLIEQLGRRQAIDQRQPLGARQRAARCASALARRRRRARAAASGGVRRGAAPPPGRGASRASAASDSRTKRERRNAAARRSDAGSARIADQRDHILDLVGVEEAEPLVDVGRDAARLERALELAVARASGTGSRCRPARPRAARRSSRSRTVPSRRSRAISAADGVGARPRMPSPTIDAERRLVRSARRGGRRPSRRRRRPGSRSESS